MATNSDLADVSFSDEHSSSSMTLQPSCLPNWCTG